MRLSNTLDYLLNPLTFFLAMFAALVGLAMLYTSERQEFMKDCMDSGRKKFECTAMWNNMNQSTYVYVR